MKKLVLLAIVVLSGWVYANDSIKPGTATLHMIIFADTEDASIGESCQVDYDNMEDLVSFIGDRVNMNVKTYYHDAAQSKKEKLLEVLSGLQVASNDAVFFYYSGHGYRTTNATSPYPRMFVTNGAFSQENQGVAVEEVRQMIAEASPRLSLIMVDACNTMINIKEPETGVSGENNIERQLQRLFLEARGEAIFCGSQAGDGDDESGQYTGYSWSNSSVGGFFTFNFNEAFLDALNSSTPAKWGNILEDTKQRTVSYSKSRLDDQLPGNQVQIPVYESNIE